MKENVRVKIIFANFQGEPENVTTFDDKEFSENLRK